MAQSVGDQMGNLTTPFWYVVVAGIAALIFGESSTTDWSMPPYGSSSVFSRFSCLVTHLLPICPTMSAERHESPESVATESGDYAIGHYSSNQPRGTIGNKQIAGAIHGYIIGLQSRRNGGASISSSSNQPFRFPQRW